MRVSRSWWLAVLPLTAIAVLLARRGDAPAPNVKPLVAPLPERSHNAIPSGEVRHRWSPTTIAEHAPPTWHGVVVDAATGLPVSEATVRLCVDRQCETEIAEGESDADGSFSIETPAPDEGQPDPPLPRAVRATHEDYAAAFLVGAALANAPFAPLRIELREPGVIHGHVLSAGGAPVPDASVGWYFAETPNSNTSATTDEDGVFSLADLPATELVVFALREGELTTAGVVRVDLRTGGTRDVTIQLEAQPATRVSGRVVDRSGRGVALVRVRATAVASGEVDDTTHLLLARDMPTTDLDGAFTLDLGRAGRYRLTFLAFDTTLDEVLAEWEGALSSSSTPIVIPVWAPTVRCVLRGSNGGPLPLVVVAVNYQRERSVGRIAVADGEGTRRELIIPWSAPGHLKVWMRARPRGTFGIAELGGPNDACEPVVQLQPAIPEITIAQ